MISSLKDTNPRAIMAGQYYVSALFAKPFKRIMCNLKLSLMKHIIYADGMTELQIQSLLRNM